MSNLDRNPALPLLPPRPADSHKGLFGHVLVIAGSRGMAGAAALAGLSALRSGAGLVRVACPAEIQPTVAQFEPSYMTYPLAANAEGQITESPPNRATLAQFAGEATVAAIGPGLGQGQEIRALIQALLATLTLPIVLDADGLNAMVGHLDLLKARNGATILTPHPGECARLLGTTTAEVQSDRESAATSLASQTGAVVVLKGHGTLVTDGQSFYVNPTGNPGMATGGAGDVLTGVIAALLAQGLAPFAAAQLGTYVHGLAGDLARDDHGQIGLIAGDLVDALPDAFVVLEQAQASG